MDRFIFLEDLHDGGAAEEPDAARSAEPRRIPDLRRLLERAINGTAHDDGWASLSSVANHVTRVEPSFSVKDYGASKLVDLVRAQDYLEVEQPDGGSVRVRLADQHRRTGRKKAATRKTAAKKTTRPATRRAPARRRRAEPAPEPERRRAAGARDPRPRAGAAHGHHPQALAASRAARESSQSG